MGHGNLIEHVLEAGQSACIHGVAEERDLHFNGPEFADGHWSAMQSGAEIGPEAKVTNVGA